MEVTRLFEIIPRQLHNHPLKVALAGKQNGKWTTYSSEDFKKFTERLSFGLLSMGLQRNEKIAIISNNRPEWNFIDLGCIQAGGINVPIYPTISENDLRFILEDAAVKFIFVSSRELFEKVKK